MYMWEGPDGPTILGHIRKGEYPSVEFTLLQLRGLSIPHCQHSTCGFLTVVRCRKSTLLMTFLGAVVGSAISCRLAFTGAFDMPLASIRIDLRLSRRCNPMVYRKDL